ncbi:hypothetical protein [Streptomyces sp. NPDC126499]|uniref:hypothetical protein n=1 Tax=Streptomyces sp. NPDC126499 TaxID=3155314 RepID=UPI0033169BC0
MSGNDPDLQASDDALAQIVKGIDKAHGELKDLSLGQSAVTGRGFSKLALTGVQLGHRGLAEQLQTFCERWGWGVRGLMQKATGFTAALGLSAGAFGEQERYVKDTFKIVVNAGNGNPHLSEDEVKQKSWDELQRQSPYDGADWSPESFSQAQGNVERTWRDTAADVQDGIIGSPVEARMRDRLEPGAETTGEATTRAQEPSRGDR